MSDSNSDNNLNALFGGQTRAAALSREEECLLKTALAVVVVKRQRQAASVAAIGKANKRLKTSATTCKVERLFASGSNDTDDGHTPQRKLLLQLPHPQHVQRIFQAAKTITKKGMTCQGTMNHLTHQLQLWMVQDPSAVQTFLQKEFCSSSFSILQGIIEHCTQEELLDLLFTILVQYVHALYHDTRIVLLEKSCDINELAVGWMRLLERCMIAAGNHGHSNVFVQQLQQVFGQDLLVPLSDNPALLTTYWQLSKSSPLEREGARLDPGAKLILQLGLYRLLYLQQPMNSSQKD